MRRLLPLVAAAGLLAPALAGGVPAGAYPVAPGSFMSPNVEWLGTIPDATAVSAKFVPDATGKAKWMYLSTLKGLSIYDVSNPAVPVPQGRFPLPNFENEDMEGNENIAVISFDGILGGEVYIVDVRNKLAPTLLSTFTAEDGSGHTAHCIDNCNRWLYVAGGSTITIADLKDPANPELTVIPNPETVGSPHDMDVDSAGILWMTGGDGGGGFAIKPIRTGPPALVARTRKASPTNPVLITDMVVNGKNVGSSPEVNDFILHNSKRPVSATYTQTKGKSPIAKGGVLLVTEEDYVPNCEGQGRFHTFDASGTGTGQPLRLLDTWKLEEGTVAPQNGERATGTVFCSAHWFTVKDNIVAMGWYGGGTRFLDVSNPRDIRQVGYFVSADQETWASYWVPGSDGIVYSVDVERGLDILKFTKPAPGAKFTAPAPIRTPGRLSFLRPRPNSPYAYACPIVAPRR